MKLDIEELKRLEAEMYENEQMNSEAEMYENEQMNSEAEMYARTCEHEDAGDRV